MKINSTINIVSIIKILGLFKMLLMGVRHWLQRDN